MSDVNQPQSNIPVQPMGMPQAAPMQPMAAPAPVAPAPMPVMQSAPVMNVSPQAAAMAQSHSETKKDKKTKSKSGGGGFIGGFIGGLVGCTVIAGVLMANGAISASDLLGGNSEDPVSEMQIQVDAMETSFKDFQAEFTVLSEAVDVEALADMTEQVELMETDMVAMKETIESILTTVKTEQTNNQAGENTTTRNSAPNIADKISNVNAGESGVAQYNDEQQKPTVIVEQVEKPAPQKTQNEKPVDSTIPPMPQM